MVDTVGASIDARGRNCLAVQLVDSCSQRVLLLLHLIQIPLAAATVFFSLIFMGVSQLLYIIPAIVIYRRKGRPGVVKGLIIAAALTFLLNATCSALVLGNLNIH